MTPNARTRLRAAALVVGLFVALVPAALLAYDVDGSPIGGQRVIAQATPTAAPKAASPTATAAPKTATPAAAPKTGSAGLLGDSQGTGLVATLLVLTAAVILGGRAVASRKA